MAARSKPAPDDTTAPDADVPVKPRKPRVVSPAVALGRAVEAVSKAQDKVTKHDAKYADVDQKRAELVKAVEEAVANRDAALSSAGINVQQPVVTPDPEPVTDSGE